MNKVAINIGLVQTDTKNTNKLRVLGNLGGSNASYCDISSHALSMTRGTRATYVLVVNRASISAVDVYCLAKTVTNLL